MGRSRTSFGTGNPGRPRGATNKATREIKGFAEQFLTSKEYAENAIRRVLKGKAPHLEVLWHHYGFGKPKETVKHEGRARALVIDSVSTRKEMLEALGAKDTDAGGDDDAD